MCIYIYVRHVNPVTAQQLTRSRCGAAAGRRQGLCCILLSIPLQFPRSHLAALVTKDKLQHVAARKVCPKSRVRRSKKYKMKTQ